MRAIIATAAALLCTACGTTGLYHWGDYERSVGRVSAPDEAFDVASEIDGLETDLEQAQNKDRPVPPGFHAHLGYLYFLKGDVDRAARQLTTEKERYPESAAFVDGLLANMGAAPTPAP